MVFNFVVTVFLPIGSIDPLECHGIGRLGRPERVENLERRSVSLRVALLHCIPDLADLSLLGIVPGKAESHLGAAVLELAAAGLGDAAAPALFGLLRRLRLAAVALLM